MIDRAPDQATILPFRRLHDMPGTPGRKDRDVASVSILLPNVRCVREVRRWLRELDGCQGELVAAVDAADESLWRDVAREAADDYRVRPLRVIGGGRLGVGLQACIQHMSGDAALVYWPHSPDWDLSLLPRWLHVLEARGADAILGGQVIPGERVITGARRTLRDRALTTVYNLCFGTAAGAPWTSPVLIRADVLRQLRLVRRGNGVVAELLCRLAQWHAKIIELPHGAHSRSTADAAAGMLDALCWLWRTVACRLWDTEFTTHAGFCVLTAVARANRYNRWIVDQIRPFLGHRVLEAGAGIGNLSPLLLECERLLLADRENIYLDRLERRFGQQEHVRCVDVDLTRSDDLAHLGEERLDTIFCSNVLEHLEPDREVLDSFVGALQPGGHCILVVPAGPGLYTGLDAELGHYRRYSPDELREKMRAVGFDVVFERRFSKLGTLGWVVSGRLLRRRTLSPRQMIWFDRLLPLAKLLDRILPVPGMSLIMVGRKPETAQHSARLAA